MPLFETGTSSSKTKLKPSCMNSRKDQSRSDHQTQGLRQQRPSEDKHIQSTTFSSKFPNNDDFPPLPFKATACFVSPLQHQYPNGRPSRRRLRRALFSSQRALQKPDTNRSFIHVLPSQDFDFRILLSNSCEISPSSVHPKRTFHKNKKDSKKSFRTLSPLYLLFQKKSKRYKIRQTLRAVSLARTA